MSTTGNLFLSYFDHPHRILNSIIILLIYTVVTTLYVVWIVKLSLIIKNRRRRLKQIQTIVCTNFEEEEVQKWNLYNENTFIVKETCLLVISIAEVGFIILISILHVYESLETYLIQFNNVTVEPEFACLRGRRSYILYTQRITMLLKGISEIILHSTILLICSLMDYLKNRYLIRKMNRHIRLIVYGAISSLLILSVHTPYTYFFELLVYVIYMVDWFLLVRFGRRLSLVLIGRIREIQQCFGGGERYQIEYNKYLTFRVFHLLFHSGLFIIFCGQFLAAIIHVKDRYVYPCTDLKINLASSVNTNLGKLIFISKFLSEIGVMITFMPILLFSICLSLRTLVGIFKKKKNFHDEKIKPLIERYHESLVNS